MNQNIQNRLFADTKATSLMGLALGVASIVALAVSARIQIPMIPVPMTMQTVVVLLLPFLMGWRFALATVAAYIGAGALGFPVFAGGAGPLYLMGPTGGYLLGFLVAVWGIGQVSDRFTLSPLSVFTLMIAGHAAILGLGGLWLAFGVPSQGLHTAFIAGIAPFILGSVLKSALAAVILAYPKRSTH